MTVTTNQPPTPPLQPANRREIWQMPWGWPEAGMLLGGVIYIAFLLQFLLASRNIHLTVPVPWNWFIPIGITVLALLAGLAGRRNAFVRWLGGLPFAVTSIIIYTILGLTGILIKQGAPDEMSMMHHAAPTTMMKFGLNTLYSSIPFLVASVLIMINLATVVGRRFATPRPGFISFVLNHLGLLIVMTGMIAGTAQRISASIELFPGQTVKEAQITKDNMMTMTTDVVATYPLGASLTLDRFNIDYYPPTAHLIIINMREMMNQGKDSHQIDDVAVARGHTFDAYGVAVKVLAYLPSAKQDASGNWKPVDTGGEPVAQIEYTAPNGADGMHWITEGMGQPLMIGTDFAVMMQAERVPKRYQSFVTLTRDGAQSEKAVIEVNKPLHIGKWWLYQSSYGTDRQTGQTYTVLDARTDPALPVVYTGLICIVLGAFMAFWFTPRRRVAVETSEANTEEAN